jgi:hypothetical protein
MTSTDVTSVWYIIDSMSLHTDLELSQQVHALRASLVSCIHIHKSSGLDMWGRFYALLLTRDHIYTSGAVCVPSKTRSKDGRLSDHCSRINGHWFGSFGTGRFESLNVHKTHHHCVSICAQFFFWQKFHWSINNYHGRFLGHPTMTTYTSTRCRYAAVLASSPTLDAPEYQPSPMMPIVNQKKLT